MINISNECSVPFFPICYINERETLSSVQRGQFVHENNLLQTQIACKSEINFRLPWTYDIAFKAIILLKTFFFQTILKKQNSGENGSEENIPIAG